MFGFVTKANHEAELEASRSLLTGLLREAERMRDYWSSEAETARAEANRLSAEIDHLRPLAQKHLNSLAALKQNKGRKA